ncbi:hypothetical protein D3C85_173400 [compost metagenome]
MADNFVILPLSSDAFYEYAVSLEGNSYILQFVYNERASLYFFSLYTAERVPVVLGEALVPTYPLFTDYALPNLTGYFCLQEKATITGEPYKEFPDKINEYYDLFYLF